MMFRCEYLPYGCHLRESLLASEHRYYYGRDLMLLKLASNMMSSGAVIFLKIKKLYYSDSL